MPKDSITVDLIRDQLSKLPTFLETIIALLYGPYGPVFGVILVAVLVISANYLFKLMEGGVFSHYISQKRKRVEVLTASLADINADPNYSSVVRDILEAEQFQAATGIYAERKKRRGIVELYNRTSAHVSWEVIRRAKEFLFFDSFGDVTMRKPSFYESSLFWVTFIGGWAFYFVATISYVVITALVVMKAKNPIVTIFWNSSLYFLIVLVTAVVLRETLSHRAATQIRAELLSLPSS